MKSVAGALLLLLFLSCSVHLRAQEEEGNDNRKSNGNLGWPISVPLNPTGQFAKVGTGITYGAGYNFTRSHAVIGEFMWDWLHPNVNNLIGVSGVSGHSNLYAITGEYRYERRGETFGTYFIAGGGWYWRHSSLTTSVVTGSSITCTTAWVWWGATCSSGVVTSTETLKSSTTNALGGNAGIGFTIRVAEAPWRVYVEARYHYAPMKNVNTQLVLTTVGIRY